MSDSIIFLAILYSLLCLLDRHVCKFSCCFFQIQTLLLQVEEWLRLALDGFYLFIFLFTLGITEIGYFKLDYCRSAG